MRSPLALAAVLAIAFAGCSGHSNRASGDAQAAADSVTKSVYADDVDQVGANFDDDLKQTVTRSEVGILSDQMHKLGDYKGLTFVSQDPGKSEFTYRADFTNGTMNVVVRLDPSGKISAYRVFPNSVQ
jgi:hypothetical protein